MATIIKKGLSIYCSLGGPYISPIIVPLINLINIISFPIFISCWAILLISIFIPINFSGKNILNTSTNPDNTKRKNPGKAFGISFAIYYIIMVSCMCVIMQSACKVNDMIPDF
jgi:hypothetical protein